MKTLSNLPIHLLGELLETSIKSSQPRISNCELCGKHCRILDVCEYCLADELYSRRTTMQFMKLDLTLQAAVCLIAKNKSDSGTLGAQARGARQPAFNLAHEAIYTDSGNKNAQNFYSEFFGDSDNDEHYTRTGDENA